ncbi:hypothetical protein, partial [Cohnella xylanilytica]|uniref:hypothetical protein n=1 Tax=Cohnella xylanilytica TaxID=557555 RepID=UPI001C887399
IQECLEKKGPMNRNPVMPIPIPIATMNETSLPPYPKKFVSEMVFRRKKRPHAAPRTKSR